MYTGVLTETTAELAAALTLAAARRVPEADVFMRAGHYKGWLPTLFIGQLLQVSHTHTHTSTSTSTHVQCLDLPSSTCAYVAEPGWFFVRAIFHVCLCVCVCVCVCTQNKTVGIIGAGRIGAAYARMMVEGHKMNLLYYDPYPNKKLVRRAMATSPFTHTPP